MSKNKCLKKNAVSTTTQSQSNNISLGLTPYKPHATPSWADPDNASYHMFSAAILGASFAGRWYAPKINVTRIPFTINIILVPFFYLLAINHKEKRFAYGSEARRSFDQNLEFYPITRRAFNRAKAIRESEISSSN